MTPPFTTACLQLSPGNDLTKNLADIARLVAGAAAQGATLVALPEFATYLDRDSRSMRASATAEGDSPVLAALCGLARRHRVWMIAGSLVMRRSDDLRGHLSNRSFLISDQGERVAAYDKIHLFDATLRDGRRVGESRHYAGGGEAPVVTTPLCRIGMTICYDLRFPHLYRALAQAGAEVISIPSAFTSETGRAHWEPLLRARAIETGCFVLAPATTGTHPGDWRTHGHAAIVDPWGRIIAVCDDTPGTFCLARIDPAEVGTARGRIPSLETNPAFSIRDITYARTT